MARAPIPLPRSARPAAHGGMPNDMWRTIGTGLNRNANGLIGLGMGLLQGKNFSEGLALGGQGFMQGAELDRSRNREYADSLESEKQTNATIDWLAQNGRDDLIAQLEAGRPMSEVWAEATAKPKVPEGFTLGEGQVRYDGAGNVIARGGEPQPDPKDAFGFEKDLYGQYANADPVKVYEDVKAGYERVRSSATSDSGPGDMGLIYGFMKMLDPTSVVREGEFATAENAGGVAPQVWNLYNKLLTGERLTPEQRATFVRAADDLYAQAAGNLGQINQQFTERANAWGVEPGRFIRQPETYDPWTAPAAAPRAPSTTGNATGGFRVLGVR